MTPKERELLEAMGNCYRACHASFEETLDMISGWRGFTADEVKEILLNLKSTHKSDPEYTRLRDRFPKDFPV